MFPTLPQTTYNQYDPTQFLNNLPAYDQSEGTNELLELARELIYSGNYYWIGASFPYGSNILIPANGTSNGSLAIPSGSYVTSITYYNDPIVNPEGFKFKLWDKGTKAPIVYGGYILSRCIASDMVLQNMSGIVAGEPYGPAWLTSPLIVTPPGMINWEIVNLSPAAANIQMMLSCAVPVRNETIGVKKIQK